VALSFERAASGNGTDMDRYQQLIEKRDSEGLTKDEADELGKLLAERKGKGDEYANAQDPPEEVELARTGLAGDEEELQEIREEGGTNRPTLEKALRKREPGGRSH
jgi:hypothetical protein